MKTILALVVSVLIVACGNQVFKMDVDPMPEQWHCFDYDFYDGRVYAAGDSCYPETEGSKQVATCFASKAECEQVRATKVGLVPDKNAMVVEVDCRTAVKVGDAVGFFEPTGVERLSAVDARLRHVPLTGIAVHKISSELALVVVQGTISGYKDLVQDQHYYVQVLPGKISTTKPQGGAVVADWVIGHSTSSSTLVVGYFHTVFRR